MTSYQEAAHLRAFMFKLGAVFAVDADEADEIASEYGLWDRRPDGSWGRDATEAHVQLCLDQQAAYRSIARAENAQAREALGREEND